MAIVINRSSLGRHKIHVPPIQQLLNVAFFVALLGSLAIGAFSADTDPIVQVTGGQIKGRPIAGGGASVQGVPFAQPPLGDLRWRDAAPVKQWIGIRDAAAFGPACTQEISGFNVQEGHGSKEDCLYSQRVDGRVAL